MKPVIPRVIPLAILSLCSCLAVAGRPAVAQTITWSGSAAPTLNWSNAGNWFGGVVPGSSGTVLFNDAGATPTAGTITASITTSATIAALNLRNTTGNRQNLEIASGQTLSISSTANAASFEMNLAGVTGTNTTLVAISGLGRFAFDNPNGTFATSQYNGLSTQRYTSTLDMSGLSTLTANANIFSIRGVSAANVWRLAQSSTLTGNSMIVGNWDTGSRVELGQSSTLNISDIYIGSQPAGYAGGPITDAQMVFQSGLTSPQVKFRGKGGTDADRANLSIGFADQNTNSATLGNIALDLSGGSVDGKFNTIRMGRNLNGSGGNGSLSFDAGIIDANTMLLGEMSTNGGNPNQRTTATVNINGGLLDSGTITIANMLSSDSRGTVSGIINLNRGGLRASSIQSGTSTAGGNWIRQINFSSGTIANRAGGNLTIGSGLDIGLLTTGSHEFSADATRSITVGSAMRGIGGLTKTGAGSLTLSAANTFAGATALTSGSLVIGDANALRNSTLVGSVGTGVAINQDSTLGDLAGSAVVNAGSFSLAIGNNNSVTTQSGGLSAGSVTKIGSGVLLLTGSNALSTATVSAGGLGFGRRTSAPSGSTTVASGATIGLGVSASDTATYYSAADIDALFAGTFSGVSNTAGVSNVGIDTSSGDFTYALNITGSRGLAKFGTNTLTLTGNNTFSGGIQVAGGRVVPQSAGAIGSGTVTIAAGTFDVGSLANVTNSVTVTGTGSLAVAVGNSYAGTTRIEGGTLLFNSAAGVPTQVIGPLVFNSGAGGVALARPVDQDLKVTLGSLTRTAGAVGNFVPGGGTNSATNGVSISGQAAAFINTGVYFDDSNFAWYQGTGTNGFVRGIDYVNDGGTVRTTGSTSSNVSSIAHQQFTGNASGQSGGTFTTLAFTQTATTYANSGSVTTVQGLLKSGTGTTTMSGGSGIRAPNNTDLDIRVVSGSGTLAINHAIAANGVNGLTKSGMGTLSLAGNNTFTGPTRLLEGTLEVNGASALAQSTLELSAVNSSVSINQNSTFGGLSGSRDLDLRNRVVSIGNNNSSTTYSGILSNGTLTKIGTGTLTLSGSSTYAGNTSIDNGAIVTNSLPAAGQASPLGGGTLINLGSGSTAGTLRYTGSGNTTNRVINLSGTTGGATIVANGSGALVLTGTNTATGSGVKTFTLTGSSTADNSIGIIAGTDVGVDKTDSGRWWLTGNSSYSGQLRVLDGTLVVGANVASSGASPFGTATAAGSLPIIGNSAATTGTASLLVAGGNNISRGFSVASDGGQVVVLGATGTGSAQIGTSISSIRLNRSAITLQASNSGTAVFAGNWRDGGGNANPTVAYTIGSLGNAGVVVLESEFSSSATGVNIVNGTARLQALTDDRINSATPVTIGSGLGAATLDINGQSQTLSNLSFAGNSASITGGTLRLNPSQAVAVSGTGHTISSLVALDAAASFNVNAASRLGITSAISGVGFGLTKTGAGTLELTGASTYSGNTVVGNGVVRFGSVAAGSDAQSLGGGALVNLGVTNTSSGEIDYFGVDGTLAKNITALGNGRNRIRNSGGNTLTLSGTLTKDGTILELAQGTFAVSGRITGASANSDLFVNGANVTLSNTNNDYNGPTYVYGGGTLNLGASNVIPNGSALLLGGTGSDTGTGTINTGLFTDTIASLTSSSRGATVGISINGSAAGGLTTTGDLTFGAGTDTLNLSLASLSLGKYSLLTYQGTRSGTFDTVNITNPDSRYALAYGASSNSSIDLQMKANQASTFTLNSAAGRVLVGGSTQLSGSLANSSPVNAAALAWSPASVGSLTASGFASSLGSTIAAGSTSSINAWLSAGPTAGTQTWSITNTDNNAITTVSTATGSIAVVNQRSFSLSSGTISLGNFLRTASMTGSTSVTSLGTYATTASGTLGNFVPSNTNGFTITTNDSTAFNGASSQSANYSLGGSATAAGVINGSFSSSVTAELGTISAVSVALSGTAYDSASISKVQSGNVGNGGTISIQNAAGTYRSAAFVSGTSVTGQGWSVTGFGAGTSAAAGATLAGTAHFDGTGLLSGTYTGLFSATFQNNQSYAGAVADDLGSLSWNLYQTYVNTSGSGSTTLAADTALSAVSLTSGTGAGATLASFAAGSTGSSGANVAMSFTSGTAGLYSNVLNLNGTDGLAQVLQLTYDSSLLGSTSEDSLVLAWFDTSNNQWVNSVLGNTGTNPISWTNGFQGSWATYLVSTSGSATAANSLGAFGVDQASKTVWAAINHNSQFAVTVIVPEPGALALAGIGVAAAACAARSRSPSRKRAG